MIYFTTLNVPLWLFKIYEPEFSCLVISPGVELPLMLFTSCPAVLYTDTLSSNWSAFKPFMPVDSLIVRVDVLSL